jgi:PAS domain S-box-containing protein
MQKNHAGSFCDKEFPKLLEFAPDAMILSARHGPIVLVNSQTEFLFGYSREELIGQNVDILVPVRFRVLHSNRRAEYSKAPRVRPMGMGTRIFGLKKNGEEFPVEISLSPIEIDGETLNISAIRDISERVRNEQKLNDTLKELGDFKFALDQHAILAITDRQGRITYANDQFCRISQYSRDELIGRDHRIINSGYHPKEFMREMWTTIISGRTWKGEVRNRAKDGTFYWVDATIVPFLDANGVPTQFVAIRTEITARKQAEQDREHLIEELQNVLTEVRTLSGLLPICAQCKKVRDDTGYWNQIETYISKHTDAKFSHGYCPQCAVAFLESSGLSVPDEIRKSASEQT